MARSSKMPVQRIGQSIRLRREYVDEYIKIHSEVWPGVLKRIAGSNIHDYSIFYDKQSSILFATFKYTGTDFDADMKAMAEDEETQRWWKVTDKMQESLNEGATSSVDGGWWRALDEVFHVE
ncbi:rhamnose mutarotase [Aureobasidium pullulans]|nr:rhamnose mutarotase [Aureobasidium pullulans]THX38412.1 rhamnose mutarotase [Aureobasidium pullulans]THX89481.1 rhamnose mutarotase [Aureobasidium pullulans]THY22319.1 rhamnose mutarotase [Aureobasidium pullulans]TIA38735.1 rhamnose mutarotase [Aureobasidium pullulans]